jgi:hypothetical protein
MTVEHFDMFRKKILLIVILVLVVAVAIWMAIPPQPVQICLDIAVGHEVRIPASSGSLCGSLLKPESSAARTPAVVILVGSGSYSYRRSFKPGESPFWKAIAEAFLAKGWAALLLEKRGINGSEGHWQQQSFADRADDAIAGVRYLRSRQDVDLERVGVCGHSQGGWIAQLAAALDPDEVAFVISLAGPNTSVRQQIIDDQENEWRCAGLAEDSIRKKGKWLRTKLSIYAGLSRVLKIGYLSRIINYDPVGIGARIRCPMLALYGENDTLVLPESNIRLLKDGLDKGGNTNYRIVVIPGASHGFIRIPGKCPDWNKVEKMLAPELFAAVAAWDPFQ